MKKLFGLAAAALLATVSLAHAGDTARYEITFNASWTADAHPLDYPGNAHFSGVIGATHNTGYTLFKDGGTATKGLEALSEKGAHTPLDKEIDKAISKGAAGVRFETGPLFKFPGTQKSSFVADADHPYVSAAAMIAPSPDWFTGVSNVSLKKNGKWVEEVTFPLLAWDAGTDNGTTYKAGDADAMPRQSVRLNAAPHFASDKGVRQVGTVTFKRTTNATN